MQAILEYALDGVLPENMDPLIHGYFILVKPQIDANNSRRENGRKGGSSPRQNQANSKQTQANAKQTEANTKQTEANQKQTQAKGKLM